MNKARLSRLNKRLDGMTYPLGIRAINAGFVPGKFAAEMKARDDLVVMRDRAKAAQETLYRALHDAG